MGRARPQTSVNSVETASLIEPSPPQKEEGRASRYDTLPSSGLGQPVVVVPTWQTWNFARTLSYWIAILYLEGSVLFVIGGASSMTDTGTASLKLEKGLVNGPYFAGGACFALGAYCGVLQVLNLPDDSGTTKRQLVWCGARRQWNKASKVAGKSAAAAYLIYFIGALAFQVSVMGGLVQGMDEAETIVVDWVSAVLGSICFVGAGLIEVLHNRIWQKHVVCTTQIFWLGFCNFVGGVLFLFAATAGLAGVENVEALVDLPYAIGSAMFLVGALLSLLMWKNEQFGLSLLTAINDGGEAHIERSELESEASLAIHEEFGCGRSENTQVIWLFLYVLNAAASAVLLSLLLSDVVEKNNLSMWAINDIGGAVVGLMISHGVLILCSVIHHVPTVAPHKQLLWFLRVTLVIYTANAWLEVVVLVQDYMDLLEKNSTDNLTTSIP